MTKYRAKPTVIDNIRFASKKEAQRYSELKLLEKAGAICRLELQPSFDVKLNNRHICVYRADFTYWDESKGDLVIEDVKGVRTPVYKLKKKLVEAQYGIKIQEI